MALDLRHSVRKQIDLLKKDLASATERVNTLNDEIKRHEIIYDMLVGNDQPSPRRGRPRGPQKRGPSGSMIDWNSIFQSLPKEFTLDTIGANETAREKPRAYLRQVVVRWSKEGRISRTGRGQYRKA